MHTITASEIVTRLRSTFMSGKTLSLNYRLDQLQGIKTFLDRHEKDIEDALYLDLKRPAFEAYVGDIGPTIAEISLFLKNLKKWMQPKRVKSILAVQPAKSYIQCEPYGVVLIISPWNYPLQLSLAPLIGALGAGNAAVLKPSELSPATSSVMTRYLPHYVDDESLQIIEGGIAETTNLLNEKFDYIFYTGNGRVGRIILEKAAKHLTPVTLELGGKSPCIVAKDVNVNSVARKIVWGKFTNAGQTCIAPDYILVDAEIESKLIVALKKCLVDFYGVDPVKSKDYARIINQQHYHRLMKLIDSNEEIIIGGKGMAEERYIQPTLVRKIKPDSLLMQEEIFGPILPIIPIEDIASAINFIRVRPKPLALYLFTDDKKIQDKVIKETSSGGVVINHTLMHAIVPYLPFGGVGESGSGAYHGQLSFETFSHKKAILKKSSWIDIPIIYPPYTIRKKKWLSWFF